MYFYNTNLTLEILPWIYSDEANSVIYILTFEKIDDGIQSTLYNNFHSGDLSDIYNDYDANQILLIDNLKQNLFTNTLVRWANSQAFTGKQLGGANSTCLYWARSGVRYLYNPNNSFYSDGTFGLQLWQINTNEGGLVSLPTPFIFDKAANTFGTPFNFDAEPFFYHAVGLNNASLANTLILLQTNPNHGFVSNKAHTLTTNSVNTLVAFLPTINLSSANTIIFNDIVRGTNLTIQVSYSNGTIYPLANTKVVVDSKNGYIAPKSIVTQSSVANVTVSAILVNTGSNAVFVAGWENYRNVSNLQLICTSALPSSFTVPGTYTWPCPSFSTLTVEVWGAGGGGTISAFIGANGTNSSFNNTVIGGGGKGGGNTAGPGGTASGGDINIVGQDGGSIVYHMGGSAPAGGGLGGTMIRPGAAPGGGGGGGNDGFLSYGAGSGGYALKVYTNNAISGNITIVVGIGGIGTNTGGNGGNGAVKISFS